MHPSILADLYSILLAAAAVLLIGGALFALYLSIMFAVSAWDRWDRRREERRRIAEIRKRIAPSKRSRR